MGRSSRSLRDAITPLCIEDIMEKILIEQFPSSPEPTKSIYKEIHILTCTQETEYGVNCNVSLHPSPKAALAQADIIRQNPDYNETSWNFDIHSEVIDINQFADITPIQLFHLLKQTPNLTENTKRATLEKQISSASILNNSKHSEYPSKTHKPIHSER